MRDTSDDPNNAAAGESAEPAQYSDVDTPDEEMQRLEKEWRRFCHSIGLTEIPDIRAVLAAHEANPPKHWARTQRRIREFARDRVDMHLRERDGDSGQQ